MRTGASTEALADVAAGVLGRRPAADEPLRLDSLEHAELALALEEALGVRLPDDVSLDTLEAAAAAVAAGGARSAPALQEGIGHLQWLSAALAGRPLERYYRLRVVGREHVPEAGPVVLAMNHDSLLDIPFLAVATPRRVWFMAKRELFEGALGAWFFHVLGGFPVDRAGRDLRAIRAALEVLDRGMALGMYPEGTRSRHFLPFLPGAAWAALRTGAPLVPVGITGSAESMPKGTTIPRRARVRVAFGEPMVLAREGDPRARLSRAREVTADLRSAVQGLRS